MLLGIGAGPENIIQIDENAMRTSVDSVHESLECLSSIPEPKRHANEFKQAEWGGNSCFENVIKMHRNLMISSDKANFFRIS